MHLQLAANSNHHAKLRKYYIHMSYYNKQSLMLPSYKFTKTQEVTIHHCLLIMKKMLNIIDYVITYIVTYITLAIS